MTIFLQQLGRGLRLAPNKTLLTVLDFVGQLHQKYDYASRFRSLIVGREKNLEKEIREGFSLLPVGCSIHMEEKAKQYVLENIKSAIYNRKRLLNELASYGQIPTLSDFINSNGQDIRILYKSNECWSSLKKAAGLVDYEEDSFTAIYERGMGNLLHINADGYLRFLNQFVQSKAKLKLKNEDDKTYALMLYYALYRQKLDKTPFTSVEKALNHLQHYPIFLAEIGEICNYLLANRDIETYRLTENLPGPLEQYGHYTREEIFCLLGVQTAHNTMQGQVSGCYNIKNLNTEVLFVTLHKSDKDFSPSTQYDDYVISEHLFHWQSQNKDAHNNAAGKRFMTHQADGKRFLLFVRSHKRDGFGRTAPFYCFGFVDYISSHGDRPMNIEWRLQKPVMPQFLKVV